MRPWKHKVENAERERERAWRKQLGIIIMRNKFNCSEFICQFPCVHTILAQFLDCQSLITFFYKMLCMYYPKNDVNVQSISVGTAVAAYSTTNIDSFFYFLEIEAFSQKCCMLSHSNRNHAQQCSNCPLSFLLSSCLITAPSSIKHHFYVSLTNTFWWRSPSIAF